MPKTTKSEPKKIVVMTQGDYAIIQFMEDGVEQPIGYKVVLREDCELDETLQGAMRTLARMVGGGVLRDALGLPENDKTTSKTRRKNNPGSGTGTGRKPTVPLWRWKVNPDGTFKKDDFMRLNAMNTDDKSTQQKAGNILRTLQEAELLERKPNEGTAAVYAVHPNYIPNVSKMQKDWKWGTLTTEEKKHGVQLATGS